MEESPNKLTSPETNYFLDELNGALAGESPKTPLHILDEQKITVSPLLEQDLLPPIGDKVDLDLDAQEASALGSIKGSNVVASEVSSGASVEPSRRRRVHMFEYAVKSPGNKESVSKEPKFKSVDDAVLGVLGDKSLSREELMASVQTLVEQGDIAQDNGDSPITDTAIGVALINLMNNNMLASDGEGKLKVYKIAGGSTHESKNTQEEVSPQPSLIDKMNQFVDKVTDKALEGTAYGRLVTQIEQLITQAPSTNDIKTKLKTFLLKVDGKKIEDILSNLPSIEGFVPSDEYALLVRVAEQGVAEESASREVTQASLQTPVPVLTSEQGIPVQDSKKVPPLVTTKPSIVSHTILDVEKSMKERGVPPPPPVYVPKPISDRSMSERMSEARVQAQPIDGISRNAVEQFSTTRYQEPVGPVRKEDLSKEESEKIEREMYESLGVAREKFALHEAEYKTKVREGKKLFRSIMQKLGAPGKQRPALEREVEHIEAEKAYMEAKWNLKNFISGRNVKEMPFSHANSLLGLDQVENKKTDVGVFEQAEKEYHLLQDRMLEMTPEKERSTIEKAFQKWNSLPLEYRVGLSAAFLTAGGVALGTVGVSGALAALGWRAGRALVGTNIGLAAGRLYGNAKEKEVKEKRAEFLEEYGSKKILDKDAFIEGEKELTQSFEKEKSEIQKNQIKKGLITATVAGVSTVGLGMGGQVLMGESVPSGAKVSGTIDSAPKPKVVVDANTVSTKSWFDKIFSDNERVVSKPATLETSAVPQKIDVPFELKGYEPVGVKLSNEGFIDTVSKLKTSLQGHSVSPAVEKLLAQSPLKIATDLGLYKPGQVAESAFGLQGEELTMNINGDIALMHNDGSVNILFDASGKAHQFGEYAGNTMFNADHADTSPLPTDVPSVKAPVAVETSVKSIPPTSEVGISAASPLASVAADSVVVGSSLSERGVEGGTSPIKTELRLQYENGPVRALVVNDVEVATPLPDFKSTKDVVFGKMPLKSEYQFDGDGKIRTEYNRFFTKILALMTDEERAQLFDYHLPVQYKGGRIDIFSKDGHMIALLNGEKILDATMIDGKPGYMFEGRESKGIFSVKSDYELAFDEAKKVIEKNIKFFNVKK